MFSFAELWNLFANLNERINGLVKSMKYLRYLVHDHNDQDPALQLFAPSVRKLTVRSSKFDIQPFRALRSLTLEFPCREQRNSIRLGNVPFLEYLDLHYPMKDEKLLQSIFSGELKRLKTCKLGEVLPDLRWTGSPQLRSLKINVHGPWELIGVLRVCPSLERFNAVVYSSGTSNFTPPNQSIPCLNVSLRILTVRTYFDILIPVLTICPNLEQLTFWELNKTLTYTRL